MRDGLLKATGVEYLAPDDGKTPTTMSLVSSTSLASHLMLISLVECQECYS